MVFGDRTFGKWLGVDEVMRARNDTNPVYEVSEEALEPYLRYVRTQWEDNPL